MPISSATNGVTISSLSSGAISLLCPHTVGAQIIFFTKNTSTHSPENEAIDVDGDERSTEVEVVDLGGSASEMPTTDFASAKLPIEGVDSTLTSRDGSEFTCDYADIGYGAETKSNRMDVLKTPMCRSCLLLRRRIPTTESN
ncbi:hypothetical protein HDU93_004703 [Gonapodya sp. JEL0774]|nr:hypothetical protein HDU93_004703 [Gonapodya sp. JEL0774]